MHSAFAVIAQLWAVYMCDCVNLFFTNVPQFDGQRLLFVVVNYINVTTFLDSAWSFRTFRTLLLPWLLQKYVNFGVLWHLLWITVDPRTSNGLMFEQLETRNKKIRGKSGFETQTKTRKSNNESRGRLLSLLGPDERRVIHLPVNSNIPPTIIIDWLLYNIFMYVLL
jgi:hypothetical protein